MTGPTDKNDPNVSPYVPQVHSAQRANQYLGPPQDQQRGMRGKLIESILQLVMQAITGVFLPGPLGSAFTQLQNFFANILPEQIKGPINALITILISAFDLIPIIGPPVGDAIEYLAQIFGLMRDETATAQGTGEAAQASADVANVGVARLEGKVASDNVPGGILFDDTFDRTGSDLGTDYDQFNSGPAGGTLSANGSNCVLIPSGAGQTTAAARITTAMHTDNAAISVVQNLGFQNILSPGEIQFGLRFNTARTEGILVRISLNSVNLSKIVGGAATTLATAADYGAAGDKWTLKVGTDPSAGGDVREFILMHNTAEIIRVTDTSGTPSVVGSSNRYPYIGQMNALIYIPPFFTGQEQPPNFQSVTAYDRPAAA